MEKNKIRKIAIIIIYLELKQPETAKKILVGLGRNLSKQVIKEMKNLSIVKEEQVKQTLEEVNKMISTEVILGGKNISQYLKSTIEVTDQIKKEADEDLELFTFISNYEMHDVVSFFKHEPTQVLSNILSYFSPNQLSSFFESSDDTLTEKLIENIFHDKKVSYRLIEKFDRFLEKKLSLNIGTKPEIDSSVKEDQTKNKLTQSFELLSSIKQKNIFSKLSVINKEFSEEIESNVLSLKWFFKQKKDTREAILSGINDIDFLTRVFQDVGKKNQEKVLEVMLPRTKEIFKEKLNALQDLENNIVVEEQKKFITILREFKNREFEKRDRKQKNTGD